MRMILAAALVAATPVFAQSMSTEGAMAYIVSPVDGTTVSSPVTVVFGLSGMGVAPAGTEKDGTGHHHLLIDRPPFGQGEYGAEEFELALPADDNHKHFGGGQTQVSIDLTPGSHTLQLVLGDAGHVPHDPPVMSDVITITVE